MKKIIVVCLALGVSMSVFAAGASVQVVNATGSGIDLSQAECAFVSESRPNGWYQINRFWPVVPPYTVQSVTGVNPHHCTNMGGLYAVKVNSVSSSIVDIKAGACNVWLFLPDGTQVLTTCSTPALPGNWTQTGSSVGGDPMYSPNNNGNISCFLPMSGSTVNTGIYDSTLNPTYVGSCPGKVNSTSCAMCYSSFYGQLHK